MARVTTCAREHLQIWKDNTYLHKSHIFATHPTTSYGIETNHLISKVTSSPLWIMIIKVTHFYFYMKDMSGMFNAGSKIEMFNSLIQCETLDSTRRNVRLTKPPIAIPLQTILVIEWLIYQLQLKNYKHNCYEERHVQLALIQAKPLTQSLKWVTRMFSSI